MRLVVVRPVGSAVEKLVDLARERPEFVGDYVKNEICGNTALAFIAGDDGNRVPIDEAMWRTLREAQPEVLRRLVRAVGDLVVSS